MHGLARFSFVARGFFGFMIVFYSSAKSSLESFTLSNSCTSCFLSFQCSLASFQVFVCC